MIIISESSTNIYLILSTEYVHSFNVIWCLTVSMKNEACFVLKNVFSIGH